MSQHFLQKGKPPQGISSFTKIRLRWIKKQQVQFIKPGETSFAWLSPLSKGGDLFVVKIPLSETTYYLLENRQPIGFDKILPDSGLLVLEVNTMVRDAEGPVRVKSAVSSPSFDQATYKLEVSNRNAFIDKQHDIAVIPLWMEKGNLGVLVTTPSHSEAAIKAARAIQLLTEKERSVPDSVRQMTILEAIAAFKSKDFEKSYAIATRRHDGG